MKSRIKDAGDDEPALSPSEHARILRTMAHGSQTTVTFLNGGVFSGFVPSCVRYNSGGSNQYDGPPLRTKKMAHDWATVWHIAIENGLTNKEAAAVASRSVGNP